MWPQAEITTVRGRGDATPLSYGCLTVVASSENRVSYSKMQLSSSREMPPSSFERQLSNPTGLLNLSKASSRNADRIECRISGWMGTGTPWLQGHSKRNRTGCWNARNGRSVRLEGVVRWDEFFRECQTKKEAQL